MIGNIISNPFVGCTARDMKFEEVRQYWCSPFELYRLNEGELFTSRTPIVIEGVRGTGKTMILKYLSYSVQKDFIKDLKLEQKLKYFEERSIGIYFRYKDDFCNMFDGLDCDELDKERIFRYYYELFIIRQMLEMLQDIYQEEDNDSVEKEVCAYFGITVRPIKNVYEYINSLLRKMDDIINSAFYDDAWRDKIMPLIGKGNMVVEFAQMLCNSLQGWENMLFVVLLDEYENLGRFQSMVNTLIKQVDDTVNLTYRLGMRPAGMDSNNRTNVANERLQVDSDFILRRLEYENFSEYKQFALEISEKRLQSVAIFYENGLCDINGILGKSENIDLEAKLVVQEGKKHFKLIKSSFTKDTMPDVIGELSCDEKLMEMYNVLRVMRGENYKKTGELCRRYQELRSHGKASKTEDKELHKYHLDYSSKYRMTLLYLLLTIYGEKKQYYSVNTFLRLSSGSINDFISLCRNVFKHINESMIEDLKSGAAVSSKMQTYASIDTAEDQRRKVSIPNIYCVMNVLKNVVHVKQLDVFYTEPKFYIYEEGYFDAYHGRVKERKCAPISGYCNSGEDEKEILTIFLGFDGGLADMVFFKLGEEGKEILQTYVVNGFPSYTAKLKDVSLFNNEGLINKIDRNNLLCTTANNPFETYNLLCGLIKKCKGILLNLCTIGSKPMALGTCLFALDHRSKVKVTYPFYEKTRFDVDEEPGKIWRYGIVF